MPDEPDEKESTDLIEEAAAARAEPAEEKEAPSDDTGSLVSRFQSAGLDLENVDPAELAQAHAFHSRYRGQQVFTEEELPNRVNSLLTRLSQTPQGQEYIRKFAGTQQQQPATQPAATPALDADDPYAARFQQLEQMVQQFGGTIQQQQAALQELGQARQAIEQEREAQGVKDELDGYLAQAVEGVPGARGMQRHLEDDFWAYVGAGRFKPAQLTGPGIKAWVKTRVQERSPGGGAPRKQTPSGGKRGGGGELNEKELDGLSMDDITAAFLARANLQ